MNIYTFEVLFTNGTSGHIEVSAASFTEACAKMKNNLCVRDFWTDSRSPHLN
jgi:hypothetical protein